jgi:hypothetical protein
MAADDRRRFLEKILHDCDGSRREQLLLRLEQIENTSAQGVVPVAHSVGDAVYFAKLAFKDESGAWRYGLFDPACCDVLRAGEHPTDAPILISQRSWRRSHYDPTNPLDRDKRKRMGH